jgi:heparosan-N-sulfate-glucuronate 5-epimerase
MTWTPKIARIVSLSLLAVVAAAAAAVAVYGMARAQTTSRTAALATAAVSVPVSLPAPKPQVGLLESLRSNSTTSTTPSHYYVWNTVTPPYTGPRDDRGVVLTKIKGRAKPVYNPVAVAQWGLHFYENWLHTGSDAELGDLMVQADWLRRIQDDQGRFPYSYEKRGAKAPWYSAMAQGLGISVLLRAYHVSGDGTFLTAAQRAVLPFGKNVADGGVVTEDGKWLEEYPDSHHVLNGSIFAAFGLYDMMRATGRVSSTPGPALTLAEKTWRTFTTNLASNLGRYESHGAILYETGGLNFCHITYFDLHLRQLRELTQLTGMPVFAKTARRWEKHFRAYPDPEVTVTSSSDSLQRLVLTGTARFVYPQYHTDTPHAEISFYNPDGTVTLTTSVPMTYDAARTGATFTYVRPASPKGTRYRVRVAEQPHTVDKAGRYDYSQNSSATVVVGQQ